MALLSLSKTLPHAVPLTPQLTEYYECVISDSQSSIRLLPENMKAYYFLAQAQIALSSPQSALASAKKAHELCVQETYRGGKGASSIGPITELVLRAKKEVWEMREREREDKRGGLVNKMIRLLEKDAERKIEDLRYKAAIREIADLDMEERKVREEEERECDEVRNMGVAAGIVGEEEGRRRKVPDWAVDDITFSVMLDPVVVSLSLSPVLRQQANKPKDQNRTILRSLIDHGTSETLAYRSPHSRPPPNRGFTAEPCIEGGLCGILGTEWVGCGLVNVSRILE
jgi:STIP1 family protein 1